MILSSHVILEGAGLNIYSSSEYLLTTYSVPAPSPPQYQGGNSEV